MTLSTLPPWGNNIYFNLPGGGRKLTDEARAYKTATKMHLAQHYHRELATLRPNRPLLVFLRYHMPDLLNATFGKPRGAEARYKRRDVGNSNKLIEDAIKDVTAIDDSNTLTLVLDKVLGAPRTDIFIWDREEEVTPFDDALRIT